MPLPSFLQAMFTPQRPGPGQMAWRDRDVGEGSGEISQGDIQEMYWKRGPAARGHGQQMDSAVRPQEGMGQTASQDMVEAIKKMTPGDDGGGMDSGLSSMTGLEPGGMSSITEVMQSFGDPTVDELGYGGGGAGYGGLGRGLTDIPNVTAFDDTGGLASTRGIYAEEGPGMFSQGPIMGTTPPHSSAHGFMSGGGFPGSMGPGGVSMGGDYQIPSTTRRDPTSAVADWLGEIFSGAGPTPTPGIGVGQTDPATGVPAQVSGGPMSEFFSNIWERGTGGGTPVPTPGIQPGQTDPATGIPTPIEPHWPEWLRNMFARSTQGGSGRTRMGR